MKLKIDPVQTARTILKYWNVPGDATMEEAVAVAKVVIAASERVSGGHSKYCAFEQHEAPCDCGHDALVAALKGE